MRGPTTIFLLYFPIIFTSAEVRFFFFTYILNVRSGEVALLCSKLTPHTLYLLTAVMTGNNSMHLVSSLLFKLFQLFFYLSGLLFIAARLELGTFRLHSLNRYSLTLSVL